MKTLLIILLAIYSLQTYPENLISNIYSRNTTSLNGRWNYIPDIQDNGFYGHRLQVLEDGFFLNQKPQVISDRIEYDFDKSPALNIPGDWNSQSEQLLYYEGSMWLKKDFLYYKKPNKHIFIYFGAVNYTCMVYINGKLAGEHEGGFTPFNFDVTDLVKDGENFVIVRVNNNRHKDNVPTIITDWWNYGGITREVMLVELADLHVRDYQIHLTKGKTNLISGWIKLNKSAGNQKIRLSIPELKIANDVITGEDGIAWFKLKKAPQLWSPTNPKLYQVEITFNGESLQDEIGFRNIETKDKNIILNGEPIFLKGVSIHEEAAFRNGRAWSEEDALTLLSWAKEMGCNYVRLAHYPHNEHMVRIAEKMGLMIWSEIPVYWTISWENEATYKNAERQLRDMIYRDRNRCAIIIWSIANETPHGDSRDRFLSNLVKYARSQDDSRLISMAMEVSKNENNTNIIDDNMHEFVDVVSFNQYLGWYGVETPDICRITNWLIPYNKPVIISEFGGSALQGLHGDKLERWTEEYQEELYIRNVEMFDRIDGLAGTSPWILKDFRSPRRQLVGIQDGFNRKGLVSDQGIKKKAFYVMKNWYQTKK